MTRLLLITLACCALTSGCNSLNHGTGPQLPPFPGQLVTTFHEQHFKEPSGIVFSKSRGTLFVVGDEGDSCKLHTDGTLVNKARIRKTDLEGITSNTVTGNLYALDDEGHVTDTSHHDLKQRERSAWASVADSSWRVRKNNPGPHPYIINLRRVLYGSVSHYDQYLIHFTKEFYYEKTADLPALLATTAAVTAGLLR